MGANYSIASLAVITTGCGSHSIYGAQISFFRFVVKSDLLHAEVIGERLLIILGEIVLRLDEQLALILRVVDRRIDMTRGRPIS